MCIDPRNMRTKHTIHSSLYGVNAMPHIFVKENKVLQKKKENVAKINKITNKINEVLRD